MGPLQRLWCHVAHGRGEKAFAMPTPHPKGQQFLVRCKKCGNVYTIVTPDGWTSPWKAGARIIHSDREDPVHEDQGQWYFWDSRRSVREGPFVAESDARDAYKRYYAEEGDKMSSKFKPRGRRE